MTKEILNDPPSQKRKGTILIWMLICLLVLLFAAVEYKEPFAEFVFQGGSQSARSAFTSFAEDIRNGETTGDAFTAFCREIIDHADYPE